MAPVSAVAGNKRPQAPVTHILPYPNPFLGLLPRRSWPRAKDFFTYGIDFTGASVLNAGAQLGQSISINNDADFLVVSSLGVVTLTDNTTFIAVPPILALITDTGSGRNISDIPIHFAAYFGTGSHPKYWDMTKIIPGGSQVTFNLQNLDLVNAFNVRLYLSGFKVFPFKDE